MAKKVKVFELIGGPYCGKENITELPEGYKLWAANVALWEPVYVGMMLRGKSEAK